jgi:hypothetical protein
VPRRPLLLVIGLTVGDYLLWNWSLKGNHEVIALVSGLTLLPLAVVSILTLALAAGRLLGTLTRRPVEPPRPVRSRGHRAAAGPAPVEPAASQRRAEQPPPRRIAA